MLDALARALPGWSDRATPNEPAPLQRRVF